MPQWAEDIGQRTVRRISLARALRGKDIDSDDSEDDEMDLEQDIDIEKLESEGNGALAEGDVQMQERNGGSSERQVHPRRFRLWGLAASPGDGCTAAVVSKYNTQHPNRRDRAEVVFGWCVPPDGEDGDDTTAAAAAAYNKPMPARATTEARVWEWLYGRGPEVPGTTDATDILTLASSMSTLRRQFRDVLPRVHCVFCDTRVWENGAEAICDKGHSFGTFFQLCSRPWLREGKESISKKLARLLANVFVATCASSGMPIMAPGISRVCAVCGLRCLQTAELARLAREHLGHGVPLDMSAEICGGCGGKFIV